jgi:hypothetical protein
MAAVGAVGPALLADPVSADLVRANLTADSAGTPDSMEARRAVAANSMAAVRFTAEADSTAEVDRMPEADGNRSLFARFTKNGWRLPGASRFLFLCDCIPAHGRCDLSFLRSEKYPPQALDGSKVVTFGRERWGEVPWKTCRD